MKFIILLITIAIGVGILYCSNYLFEQAENEPSVYTDLGGDVLIVEGKNHYTSRIFKEEWNNNVIASLIPEDVGFISYERYCEIVSKPVPQGYSPFICRGGKLYYGAKDIERCAWWVHNCKSTIIKEQGSRKDFILAIGIIYLTTAELC